MYLYIVLAFCLFGPSLQGRQTVCSTSEHYHCQFSSVINGPCARWVVMRAQWTLASRRLSETPFPSDERLLRRQNVKPYTLSVRPYFSGFMHRVEMKDLLHDSLVGELTWSAGLSDIFVYFSGATFMTTSVLTVLISFVADSCGQRPGSRIVNGQTASPGSWPWQISLRYNGRHICGASLITTEWAVTASHCVQQSSDPNRYTLGLGNTTIRTVLFQSMLLRNRLVLAKS